MEIGLHLGQQLQPFFGEVGKVEEHAGQVAARSGDALHQSVLTGSASRSRATMGIVDVAFLAMRTMECPATNSTFTSRCTSSRTIGSNCSWRDSAVFTTAIKSRPCSRPLERSTS